MSASRSRCERRLCSRVRRPIVWNAHAGFREVLRWVTRTFKILHLSSPETHHRTEGVSRGAVRNDASAGWRRIHRVRHTSSLGSARRGVSLQGRSESHSKAMVSVLVSVHVVSGSSTTVPYAADLCR